MYLLIKSNRFKSFQIPKLNQRANVSNKILQSKQRKIFYYVYIHIKTLLNFKKIKQWTTSLSWTTIPLTLMKSALLCQILKAIIYSFPCKTSILHCGPNLPPGILIWINLNQHYPRTLLPCFSFSILLLTNIWGPKEALGRHCTRTTNRKSTNKETLRFRSTLSVAYM